MVAGQWASSNFTCMGGCENLEDGHPPVIELPAYPLWPHPPIILPLNEGHMHLQAFLSATCVRLL